MVGANLCRNRIGCRMASTDSRRQAPPSVTHGPTGRRDKITGGIRD